MEEKEMYNWLFHYNFYKQEWTAFHRDDVNAYWNGSTPEHVMYKDKVFNELIGQLYKFELYKQ